MAIVKMKKFTLLAIKSYKKQLLKELQQFEEVHFKNLTKSDYIDKTFLSKDFSPDKIAFYENEKTKLDFAINQISPYIIKEKGLKKFTTPLPNLNYETFDNYLDSYDYESIYNKIKAADEEINFIKIESNKLRSETENLKAWTKLDISLSEIDKLKKVKSFIGTVSKINYDNFVINVEKKYSTAYIEQIGQIKEDATMLIIIPIDKDENFIDDFNEHIKSLGFSKLSLNFKGIPSEIIKANNNELIALSGKKEAATYAIKSLATELEKLQITHDYFSTILEREKVCDNFLKMEHVILIQGWTPIENVTKLNDIVSNVCGDSFYIELEEVDFNCEEVPIKLKNNSLVSAFEDVTTMYSVPRYNEIDPTPLLTPFYMFFFGLMLGDTGYGLVLLISTLLILKYIPLKASTRKFIKFFHFLSYPTIFAGFIYGSMFGVTFFAPMIGADGAPKALLDSQIDIVLMMVLSIAVGVIHVIFGIAVKGYMLIRDGKVFDAFCDSLLWIIAVLGGVGWLVCVALSLSPILTDISKYSLFLSLIGLALTQGRESETMPGKIGTGLYAVYGITSYVGDLVSYTRLVALALSGAYIAFSFNLMAGLIPEGIMRFIFGGLIVVLGQSLNLALGALGAYVHTCRLQYVEFFGKFYEGGGVPFAPLKMQNKFINISKEVQ